MRPVAKMALISATIATAGISSYFLFRKSRTRLQKDITALVPVGEVAGYQSILAKMTRAELTDTLRLLQAANSGVKITDAALKQRLTAIGQKYNIFT